MEQIYTWAEFKAVLDRINTIAEETDRITREKRGAFGPEKKRWHALWDERYALEKKREIMCRQIIPEVGATGTVHWFSDTSKAYVEKVLSPKRIQVKCNGLYSCRRIFSYRKDGRWREFGSRSESGSLRFTFDEGYDYYDPSF